MFGRSSLKLDKDFNLRTFIERNKLHEVLFKRRENGIYEFHRKNMFRKNAPEDGIYASLGLPNPVPFNSLSSAN